MSVTLALAHIAGAVIVVLAFGFGVLALWMWGQERIHKAAREEMSIALGISVDRLDDPENANRIVQFAAELFSSEKFQNRLSDLCWWVLVTWGWLSNLIQGGILIAVIWYSFTDSPSNAIYAWWVLAVAFLFWVISMALVFLCKLFTGRFPGQASLGRKNLAEFLRNSQAA